jgi:hypothetical protein
VDRAASRRQAQARRVGLQPSGRQGSGGDGAPAETLGTGRLRFVWNFEGLRFVDCEFAMQFSLQISVCAVLLCHWPQSCPHHPLSPPLASPSPPVAPAPEARAEAEAAAVAGAACGRGDLAEGRRSLRRVSGYRRSCLT